MSTVLAFAPEVERALALRSTLSAQARADFLAALRDTGRDGAEFTLERLQALLAIEEHFQALILYDQIEFLRRPAPASPPDREFAAGIQRIFLEAANGFQRFLRNSPAWSAGEDGQELALRVTGLALHAIHGFMKWGYFLDEPVRPAPWRQVHTLFLLAEHAGRAQAPFVLHPSQPSFKPSVQALYLRILVLELLNTGSLSRIQVEIADGWLASWCGDYSLDTEYSPRSHLFRVDVASASGMELIPEDAPRGSHRYLRADALKAQVEEVRAGLRHGRLYAGHGAGSVFPVEQHVALLGAIEKLQESVLEASASRIEERKHFEDREVDMALGIDTLLAKVREGPRAPGAALPPAAAVAETIEITPAGVSRVEPAAPAFAEPADAREEDVERWRVHDLSSHGYGLVADRHAAERVMLNGLVGLRNQATGGWIVATVVRKLADRALGETLVGLEVLAHRAIFVALVPAAGGDPVAALFLPGRDANGKLDSLVLRPGDFDSRDAYVVRAAGSTYRIRMNRIIRKGADWIKARFEIVSKHS